MFIIAVGVATLAAGSFTASIVGIALYGVGLGFALPCTNLLVSELVPDNRASALNLLNFSWTVGALGAPVLIAWLVNPIGLRGLLLILAVLLALLGAIEVAGVHRSGVEETTAREAQMPRQSLVLFAVLTTFFLFLYVGIENGFAGWVPSFAVRSQQTSEKTTALVQSGFWGAILLGRLLAPVALRRVRNAQMIVAGLLIAAFGGVLAILSTNLAMLAVGVIICGLGLAAIFPTAIAIFTESYGSGGAGSIVLGVCGLGGAVVPWMVGLISDRTGNLRLGLSINLLCVAISLIVFWKLISLTKPQTSTSS
jgi:fucose permease